MLVIWYGRGLRLCVYHVGRGRPYWAALYTTPEGGRDFGAESKRIVLDLYRGWQEPVEAMTESTPDNNISRTDNYLGIALDHWGTGRVTMLGDAAHAQPSTSVRARARRSRMLQRFARRWPRRVILSRRCANTSAAGLPARMRS